MHASIPTVAAEPDPMTPVEFVRKYRSADLTERAVCQEHFIDLCRLVGHPTPVEADKTGAHFTFEKGVTRVDGGIGWADVWKKGFFAFEYKKRRRNLDDALQQLSRYTASLDYPPILVACDTERLVIQTAWTNTVSKRHVITLDDILTDPDKRAILHAVFHEPEKLKPDETREGLTRKAADQFSTIVARLQHRYPDREAVAHFVNQLVFCFFAEDVRLLPEGFFARLLRQAAKRPERARDYIDRLFAAMAEPNGEMDFTDIAWFNGGLFDGRGALALDKVEIDILVALAKLDWSMIDPTIFGTLFERFLDPDKRAQIGAHYTDPAKIMMIVDPVVVRPLVAEWEAVRAEIEPIVAKVDAIVQKSAAPGDRLAADNRRRKLRLEAEGKRAVFLDRLAAVSILDPACGSGNFLYLALQAVKDLEARVLRETEVMGLSSTLPRVGPEILKGLEINPLAAELARTTIWIGDIQWGIRNGVYTRPSPILRKLDTIECRDALVTFVPDEDGADETGSAANGTAPVEASAEPERPAPSVPGTLDGVPGRWVEADWPAAEFIVGNPPFLGGKKLRSGLGDDAVDRLFALYAGRVPAEADLVTYWFEKARNQIAAGRTKRAGLVSTNSIRGGANRKVLERVARDAPIFEAWGDEPWVVDGAAVRVSLVCFGTVGDTLMLDGFLVPAINTDLSPHDADLTTAVPLAENAGVAFMGDTKGGAFDIPGDLARDWLRAPLNPNGRPNSDVLIKWINGLDVTRRPRDMWIVDFGTKLSETHAALYELPFLHVLKDVQPIRMQNNRENYRQFWWRHVEPRPGLVESIAHTRFIGTPRVAKHRVFVQLDYPTLPDSQIIAIARDDDTTFGVLHSRFHETWSLRLGTFLGVGNDPRYTPTTTFETFPFPEGLTPNIPAAAYADDPRAVRIAAAARRLDALRRAWLNPPDLVDIVPEIVPTAAPGEAPVKYPDRILPKTEAAAAELKKRTLTNLYNQRPRWLADAHADLDRAVAAAYGWPEDIAIEDALARLLALNRERAAAEAAREAGTAGGRGGKRRPRSEPAA